MELTTTRADAGGASRAAAPARNSGADPRAVVDVTECDACAEFVDEPEAAER